MYGLCVEGIPFTRMFEKLSGMYILKAGGATTTFADRSLDYREGVSPSGFTRHQDGRDDPAVCFSYNETLRGHNTLWASRFTGLIARSTSRSALAVPTDQPLGRNFDSYHYLSMIIYLLSNDHVDIRMSDEEPRTEWEAERAEDFAGMLEIIFGLVSRCVLLALLHTRLPSIKTAWQTLLRGAGVLKNKEAFRILISAGMDNDWLDQTSRGHEYLYHAVQNDCADIIDVLLKRGCRSYSSKAYSPRECSSYGYSSFDFTKQGSAIKAALDNGKLDYTMLLIQHCDFDPLHSRLPGSAATNFLEFIVQFDDTNPDHHRCLDFFLEQGADVDYEIDYHFPQNLWSTLSAEKLLGGYLPLSILDFVFCFHRPLFPKLAVFSKAPLRFSRARALLCLEEGVHVIRDYLKFNQAVARPCEEGNDVPMDSLKLSGHSHHCLEILLAEQLLLRLCENPRKFCWKTMQGLLELGISLAWLSQDEHLAPDILRATARLITSEDGPDKEHGLQILQWLFTQGFQVQEIALERAVEDHGVLILECLASYCSDLKKHGIDALSMAISRNNFEAVKLLLDGGVDPNSTAYYLGLQSMISIAAIATSTISGFATMKYLIQRGAEPRSWRQHGHPSDLLVELFRWSRRGEVDLFTKVKYIVEEYIPITEPSCPSSYLLEMSLNSLKFEPHETWPIFEYLLKKGAKLGPGSPLAEWIGTGGRHQLVREMLDSGADPNAYSFENARASGIEHFHSQTPLQAAAGIGDYTLVCLLLERGVDVNQPALGRFGKTALQAICTWDPIRSEERIRKDKIIKLFLETGADVNAANSTGHTALIYAAQLGDLSTAFSLLKHGAKLDVRSTDPYENVDEYQQTALDIAAYHGRLDMVEFLLNANALSWTACYDGRDYDGAMEWARKGNQLVVSELICKHSADRKRWNMPQGQTVDTGTPPERTPQLLSVRAKSGTASWPQPGIRALPHETLQGDTVLDRTNCLSYAFDEAMGESSTASFKTKEGGISGAKPTDVSWSLVVEEIEDVPPLADTGREKASGEQSDETATQAFGLCNTSSEPGGWLYQPGEQN